MNEIIGCEFWSGGLITLAEVINTHVEKVLILKASKH